MIRRYDRAGEMLMSLMRYYGIPSPLRADYRFEHRTLSRNLNLEPGLRYGVFLNEFLFFNLKRDI